jgi:hypothetical protein
MMRELIAIIAAFGLLGCASAAAAPQQKGGGKPPQASTPQIAPATLGDIGPAAPLLGPHSCRTA